MWTSCSFVPSQKNRLCAKRRPLQSHGAGTHHRSVTYCTYQPSILLPHHCLLPTINFNMHVSFLFSISLVRIQPNDELSSLFLDLLESIEVSCTPGSYAICSCTEPHVWKWQKTFSQILKCMKQEKWENGDVNWYCCTEGMVDLWNDVECGTSVLVNEWVFHDWIMDHCFQCFSAIAKLLHNPNKETQQKHHQPSIRRTSRTLEPRM